MLLLDPAGAYTTYHPMRQLNSSATDTNFFRSTNELGSLSPRVQRWWWSWYERWRSNSYSRVLRRTGKTTMITSEYDPSNRGLYRVQDRKKGWMMLQLLDDGNQRKEYTIASTVGWKEGEWAWQPSAMSQRASDMKWIEIMYQKWEQKVNIIIKQFIIQLNAKYIHWFFLASSWFLWKYV